MGNASPFIVSFLFLGDNNVDLMKGDMKGAYKTVFYV